MIPCSSPPFLKGGRGDYKASRKKLLSLLQNSPKTPFCHSERSEESRIFRRLRSFTSFRMTETNGFARASFGNCSKDNLPAPPGAGRPWAFIITRSCADKNFRPLSFIPPPPSAVYCQPGAEFTGSGDPGKVLCTCGEAIHDMIAALDPEGGS